MTESEKRYDDWQRITKEDLKKINGSSKDSDENKNKK